jgi:hypothetical protein
MGYCSQFPGVIPHPRADYPRVTEPSAESRRLSTRMSKSHSNSGGRRQDQPELILCTHNKLQANRISPHRRASEMRDHTSMGGFLKSPPFRQHRRWADHISQPRRNAALWPICIRLYKPFLRPTTRICCPRYLGFSPKEVDHDSLNSRGSFSTLIT